MDRMLEETIRERIRRSISPFIVEAKEEVEVKRAYLNKERPADVFKASITSKSLSLSISEIRFHQSFFYKEEDYFSYTLDNLPSSPFSLKSVLKILLDEGYYVPQSLFEEGKDNYSINKSVIKRDEKGLNRFFSSLKSFEIDSFVLTLSYRKSDEGSFSLSSHFSSPCYVDLGALDSLSLGILDYDSNVTKDKRKALSAYMNALNPFLIKAGLERLSIVDYMILVEAMQDKRKDQDFSITIEKRKGSYGDITPLDFSYYIGGFKDSKEEREAFFSYYDSLYERKDDKKERSYYLNILGLSESASDSDIEMAYRKKIKAFHPDKIASLNLDDAFIAFANAESAKLNEAYRALKKP